MMLATMAGISTTTLDCGATLLVEPAENVASVAFGVLLPAGSASEAPDEDGYAAMLSELLFRGAGRRDSREHSDDLDRLGVQRSSRVLTHHLRLGAVMVGSRAINALELMGDMITQPALPDDAIDAVRRLCLQALDSLDDDPNRLVMIRLREHHLPPPFNRHACGDRGVLEQCSIDSIRRAWSSRAVPGGSIFSLAGAVDSDQAADRLNELLGGWAGEHREPEKTGKPSRGCSHTTQDTSQVHIGIAFDAPPELNEDSMLERLAIGVMSGGTSGRLFTEVRQKRSLCYSVGASYHAGRDRGLVSLYAGTTPERAQETVDVCIEQIQALRKGARADEFARAVIGLKSHLVMQGESTSARAAAIATDHFRLGRARTLNELADAVDAVTLETLNAYLARRDFGEFTMATIGPTELQLPS